MPAEDRASIIKRDGLDFGSTQINADSHTSDSNVSKRSATDAEDLRI